MKQENNSAAKQKNVPYDLYRISLYTPATGVMLGAYSV